MVEAPRANPPVVSRHREEVGRTVVGSPSGGCGRRCAICRAGSVTGSWLIRSCGAWVGSRAGATRLCSQPATDRGHCCRSRHRRAEHPSCEETGLLPTSGRAGFSPGTRGGRVTVPGMGTHPESSSPCPRPRTPAYLTPRPDPKRPIAEAVTFAWRGTSTALPSRWGVGMGPAPPVPAPRQRWSSTRLRWRRSVDGGASWRVQQETRGSILRGGRGARCAFSCSHRATWRTSATGWSVRSRS